MTRRSGTIAIRGGEILAAGAATRRADILVRDGVIAEVGDFEPPSGTREIDAGGCFVCAGLINSHYHSAESFNPGLYENLPLDLWFVHSHQVTRTAPPAPEVVYARTMLGAMIMLRAGTTSVVDFLYEAPEITLETLEAVVHAYREVGMRATILLGVADRTFAESLPLSDEERAAWADEAEPPGRERILRLGAEAVDRWHDPGGLIGIGWGPSAPQRCSPELIAATMSMARERGLVWQTHALETRSQAMTAQQRHGASFVEALADAGILGPPATLVHTVWLTDRDIELLAATGTLAVHCLASNLRLGDGVARLPAMRAAGVRVALGTDGRGCDERLDALELARLTALVHKARGGRHEDWPSAAESLAMITAEASAFTGHGERLGRVEPGAHADLLVLDGGAATFTPRHDPVRQLVYGGGPADIRMVITAGEVVLEDGRLTRVDERAMLADAAAAAASEAALPGDDERRERLEALVEGVYRRAEQFRAPVDAYIPS